MDLYGNFSSRKCGLTFSPQKNIRNWGNKKIKCENFRLKKENPLLKYGGRKRGESRVEEGVGIKRISIVKR